MLDHEINNSDFAWKATGHSDNMNWNFHDLHLSSPEKSIEQVMGPNTSFLWL